MPCTSRPCSASCPRSGGAPGTRHCPRHARSPRKCSDGWTRPARRPGGSWRRSRCSAPPRRWPRRPRWPGFPTSSPRWTRHPSQGCCRCARTRASARSVFPHPLVQAAVYEQLGPLRRMQLHSAAAEFVEDEGALLRHRVLATTPPNAELASELEAFARREAAVGAWASAAWALVEGSNLSPNREMREQRLLLAVDARSARATCTRPRASPGTSRRSAAAPGGTPRSATWPSCADVATRPRSCWATPGGSPPTTRTPRWPRWWPSGWPCTPSGGCAATRWSVGRRAGDRTGPTRRAGPASRPRRCSGWAWGGRARSTRA